MDVASGGPRTHEADAWKDAGGPSVTDAAAEIGNTADLAEAERLEEERVLREAENQPDLPDRAFDRITPQV